MLRLPDPYDEDVRRCREILRAGSKSFHAASLFLPARVRGPASVLYAFCRVADDAVDLVSPKHAPEAVARMRERLGKIYAGEPNDTPVDRALSVVVKRYDLPRAIPEAMLDGFEWDVEGRRYANMESLQGYCARVAATVGVMMTVLMGRRDPGVLARACDLGVAMQLSNIARDVGEDAAMGRLYLPRAWMRDAGLDPEAWLAHPLHSPALAGVVRRLLDAADELYARVGSGVAELPLACRPGINAARFLYAEIGHEVARRGLDPLAGRAVVSRRRKLVGLARALLLLRPRKDWVPPPPLPANAFLVHAVQAWPAGRQPLPWWSVKARLVRTVELFTLLERRERSRFAGYPR